jgi:predicted RND superfamily exporter protein
MTLAVADSIHLITGIRQARARGLEKLAAIRDSLRLNLWPIFLTSATTAIGFLSMNATGSPPLRDLGNISAIGVAAAFVFSVTLLPAVLALLPMAERVRPPREQRVMAHLGAWLVAGRWPIFGVSILVAAGLAAGMERITLDDHFVEYLDERFEFRRDSDFVSQNLTGVDVIEHAVPVGGLGSVADDAYLDLLDRFGAWYRAQPGVVHVQSLADVARRLNRAAHGDDLAFDRLPEEAGIARQQLTAFNERVPDGSTALALADSSFSTGRLIATVRDQTSAELRSLAEAADAWFARNAPDRLAPATSFSLMFAHLSARSIEGMLRSTSIALVVISLLLMFALRSVRIGLLSLVPNLAPAAIGLGLWGWAYGNLGLASSVVMAMTLGIVVDNTIHLLSKFLRFRREEGLARGAAAVRAFETVGGALGVNTIVLAAGFAALALSGFSVTAQLGALTAIVMAIALIADFLLLPALMVGRNRQPRGEDS